MNKKIAYGRVSDVKQNLDRQKDWFEQNGISIEDTFLEEMSGTIKFRPMLDKVKSIVRDGDELYIESISRLGRSTKDLLELIEYFTDKGVRIISQKENVDYSTPTGKMIAQLMCVLAEFERSLMLERTSQGITSARARGLWGGRVPKNESDVRDALKMYDSKDYSISYICKSNNMTAPTLYKYINARNDGTLENLIKEQNNRRKAVKKENRQREKFR